MPSCTCYLRVGCLLDPDLCCSCVGRSSPASRRAGAPVPALSHRHARAARGPKTGCRRHPPVCRPSRFTPSVRPGMTHRDEQSMRWFCRWTKITRITPTTSGPKPDYIPQRARTYCTDRRDRAELSSAWSPCPTATLDPEEHCMTSFVTLSYQVTHVFSSNTTAPNPTITHQFYKRGIAKIAGNVFIAQAHTTTRAPDLRRWVIHNLDDVGFF